MKTLLTLPLVIFALNARADVTYLCQHASDQFRMTVAANQDITIKRSDQSEAFRLGFLAPDDCPFQSCYSKVGAWMDAAEWSATDSAYIYVPDGVYQGIETVKVKLTILANSSQTDRYTCKLMMN